MIRTVWRKLIGFIGSAGLAVGLLVFVSVWSMLATAIAQGDIANPAVSAWAAEHPLIWPLVDALGLHKAFSSHVFLAAVFLLGFATAICAWRRTKVALTRARRLKAASLDAEVAPAGDFDVACDPSLDREQALAAAADVLRAQGIRARMRGDRLMAVSSPFSVWGSTVFHWALVALMVVVLVGQMVRSEGSMALAVTESKPDAPGSYMTVDAGPWHAWDRVERSIRVEAFEPEYKTGGIDRGAVPTVAVLDGAGKTIVSQRVYPNNMIHTGSLSINVPAVGLSVWLASVDASGSQTGQIIRYADFSQAATGGTVPLGSLASRDAAGNIVMRLSVSVPLDRSGAGYGEWVPAKPTARLRVTDADGTTLIDRVIRPDEDVALPGGGGIRLLGVGWYSRLSLVEDPTIPYVYGTMILAMLGLTLTLVMRQQLVVVTYVTGPDGPAVSVRLRLWRNVPTNRSEVERELRDALSGKTERGAL